MAAASASHTLVMYIASYGPVATVLATGDERMRRIGRFLEMSCLRKPVQSRELTIASWSGVALRAGFQKKILESLQIPVNLHTGPGKDTLGLHKDKAMEAEEMTKWIEEIRAMFRSMTDGEITKSPYDTAWVAIVPALDGSQSPQFPKSLEWIINNQLPDGSWGFCDYFSFFDRIINTLACVVALETWKSGSYAIKRGVEFIHKNLQALETEEQAHMMVGFEIVFPALMCFARSSN